MIAGVFMQTEGKRRLIRASVWVAVLALLLTVVSSLATALAASAHAALVAMTPAAGATVTEPPSEVVLEFSEPISSSFVTVTVVGPSGVSVAQGSPQVAGRVVTQPLSDLEPGIHTVTFRVVSQDGHPVSSRAQFTLAEEPAPTTTATSPDTAASSTTATSAPTARASTALDSPAGEAQREGGSATPGLLWVVAALGFLVAATTYLWRRGGRGTRG